MLKEEEVVLVEGDGVRKIGKKRKTEDTQSVI